MNSEIRRLIDELAGLPPDPCPATRAAALWVVSGITNRPLLERGMALAAESYDEELEEIISEALGDSRHGT